MKFSFIQLYYEYAMKTNVKDFLIFIICIIIFSGPFIIKAEEIEIEKEIKYKEISVEKNNEFVIKVEGKGWYLNRYSREYLSFKSRSIETNYTYFKMLPVKEGLAYLLFSYLKNDIYLLVNIIYPYEKVEKKFFENKEEEYIKVIKDNINKQEDKKLKKDNLTINNQTEIKIIPETKKSMETRENNNKVEDLDLKKESKDNEIYYIDKANKVVRVPFKSENENYSKCNKLLKEGRNIDALKCFQDYLSNCKECKNADDINYKLANLYLVQENEDEAEKYLDLVIKSGSKKYLKDAYLRKAEIDYKRGMKNKAINEYNNAYKQDKKDISILIKIGDIYYENRDYENALKSYKSVLNYNVVNDDILFKVAKIYDSPFELRDIEKAYKYYKSIIEKYSDSIHYKYAERRVKFFEKNFFNYR